MLVDVVIGFGDPGLKAIVNAVAEVNGNNPGVQRLAKGVYQIGHFGFDYEIGLKWKNFEDSYPSLQHADETKYIGSYGVCDNYQQVIDQCANLKDSDSTPYALSVTSIKKSEQYPDGGWRWHKWGDYIGTQTPTTEYIYDEPLIEEVFVYHIYKIPQHLIA